MPEFNDWFPTSRHGDNAINVMDFGAYGNGVANALSTLGFTSLSNAQNGIGGNGKTYPSATALTDTADWCAITECFKQAYTDDGTPHGTASWENKPILFPTGRYITRKPLVLTMDRSIITGTGYVQIYNEATTAPDNICVSVLGMQNCRIENINFQSAGGAGSIGLDLDARAGGVVNSTGNIFVNCFFSSPGGVGCRIGNTQMSSEMTFIRCLADNCTTGFAINNYNALNYQFLACGGISCTMNWLRISAGGNVVVQNASLAANGTDAGGYDIYVGGGTCAVIGTRTESRRFITGNLITLIGVVQTTPGYSDQIFVNGSATINNCYTTTGRLCGNGPTKTDESNTFNVTRHHITAIANNGSGLIRVTHTANPEAGAENFLNGDELVVTGVTGTGAASANGVWKINKISATQVDLLGSVHGGLTYTGLGPSGAALIGPGPQFHLREIAYTDRPNYSTTTKSGHRVPHEAAKRDWQLLWQDSGGTFDNINAAGDIVFTLPAVDWPSWADVRGAFFRFLVLSAHKITVQIEGTARSPGQRIFRAGGYATAGTSVSSGGTMAEIGNSIEIYLIDGGPNPTQDVNLMPYRWLVRSETGTWTIAGTPSP